MPAHFFQVGQSPVPMSESFALERNSRKKEPKSEKEFNESAAARL